MSETISFEINVPDVQVEALVFVYRCGLSELWVQRKDNCGRLDGPWHCGPARSVTEATFRTLDEAQAAAARLVVAAERARLIRLAVRSATEGEGGAA